ncbi:Lrp/AsnC family transcriptional regulator [Lysinibacillus sphaericus]|uniref:AsnC family transcriptional regulator n=4 Tax=Lysinibacillus TaxID=400634 RepID=A0A2S0K100_LYSSH|nr:MULTISPECIES: Lrp/AsnC family transcriptional regulator [Lysinibacillus]AHN21773.1 AsnC family transcriptional regulator [Lysinibacillus varians]AVK97065.1 AsnC family transcriptional regulator [Lysinibacillus sphaericus]MCS1382604.1 Lrp/AsnC family transcriptional regulator [Lysinibacillus sphaericus]MED4542343.1 Lrp/AsnC family transcriptional regulator [Lysinibacillus sphaericus]TKI20339.1 Lrp/AsnC family transcriptional regulator [Lysinibacillus sphaericus]
MDNIDTEILRQLQLNAKISMKELATIVHLSSPAVIERVKKLEEQGSIEGYTTKVNLKKMDRSIQAIVLFKSIDCKSLSDFCNAHPDVLACYRVAGEISYIVKLATYSVETLEQFIDAAMPYGTPSTNIVLSSTEKTMVLPFFDEK